MTIVKGGDEHGLYLHCNSYRNYHIQFVVGIMALTLLASNL